MILFGTDIAPIRTLATVLQAELRTVPAFEADQRWGFGDDLTSWRASAAERESAPAVVVAPWCQTVDRLPLNDMALDDWVRGVELPLATWAAALGAAVECCDDGGVIVAVVERAAPLDCAGWSALTAVGDGVEALVRSLARSEGPRNVRVNAVTTPTRLGETMPVDPAPSLTSFPGTIEQEVAGAVRMLSDGGAAGVTGTIVDADSGRAWR